ncbi:hypothetical protein NLJ89_g12371 [Agrocybe chaxingu]|uniref:Uncharacterized protein n=1 Tax=Agrocybe chaxingu TaxID=84603 RepID=A0A9W8MQA1_9AGAR|nr:hypothetical protein NLJ89_g12371 [Agrocybe chaxingu]
MDPPQAGQGPPPLQAMHNGQHIQQSYRPVSCQGHYPRAPNDPEAYQDVNYTPTPARSHHQPMPPTGFGFPNMEERRGQPITAHTMNPPPGFYHGSPSPFAL